MTSESDKGENLLRQAVGWIVDHLEVEANFEGVDLLLIGDPSVLADAAPVTGSYTGKPWAFVDLPKGRALAIDGPGEGDGPFVWVTRSDDGPLASVDVSPWLADSDPEALTEDVGTIECPSGRIVVGTPESIAYWGRHVDVEDEEHLAQMRADWDVPGRLYDSYIVVARVPERSPCRVVVAPSETGGVATVSIRFPIPDWLPPPRPIIDRE